MYFSNVNSGIVYVAYIINPLAWESPQQKVLADSPRVKCWIAYTVLVLPSTNPSSVAVLVTVIPTGIMATKTADDMQRVNSGKLSHTLAHTRALMHWHKHTHLCTQFLIPSVHNSQLWCTKLTTTTPTHNWSLFVSYKRNQLTNTSTHKQLLTGKFKTVGSTIRQTHGSSLGKTWGSD